MLKATSGCILLWPVACLGPKALLFFISLDVFVDNKLHFFSSLFWTKRKKYPRRNLSNITKIIRGVNKPINSLNPHCLYGDTS